MSEHLANNAITTLVNSINSSITSIVVASVSGFPAVNFRIVIDEEIMLVTAKSGNTLTVTRGAEGTTATNHDRNSFVAHTLTVQGLTNFVQQTTPEQDAKKIIVTTEGSGFTSIKDAIDSITDASLNNRYVVSVGPGIFTEDTIYMKDYVHVVGSETRGTIIELQNSPTTNDLIVFDVGTSFSSIKDCLLRNATNGSCVKYRGGVVGIENVRFYGTSDYCIDAYEVGLSGILGNSLQIINCSTAIVYATPWILRASDDGSEPLDVLVKGFYTNVTTNGVPSVAAIGIVSGGARGINTNVQFVGCCFAGDGANTGFELGDGSDLHIMGCIIKGFDKGIHIKNEGNAPEFEAVGNLIYNNTTWDILVEHIAATGSVSITSDRSKISIPTGCVMAVLVQDTTNGALVVSGDYYQGSEFSQVTNMTHSMINGPPCGVTEGGEIAVSSGRLVDIAAGNGYVQVTVGGDTHLKYVEWNAVNDLEIAANTNTSVYVNSSGVVSTIAGTGTVNFFTQIFLGRVVTDATNVIMLSDNFRDATAASTKYDKLFRLYLGPIYRSGSITTSTNLNLNVTQGDYVISTKTFQPTGGTPITFSTWYRDGGSWFTITTGQTNVPNGYWDDETGVLNSLTAGTYVKHALYSTGQGVTEKYFLVYGQEEFADEPGAINGALPSTPDPFTASAVCIAAIVVQQGAAAIADVLDQRPTLVTRINNITTTTVHGSLSGLSADDHPQYLLVDGTRAMTGNLNMGTNQITNVGNIDGVDVSAHAARHLPAGADALTTAVPNANLSAISTNSEGVQASFARSDHWHAVTAYSDGTVGLVKLDGSGDFTANEITADLMGNVTGNVTGNCSGTAANITGTLLVANGGTNSVAALNNNRIMVSSAGAIIEASAITANRALSSNASGIPVASATTSTELGYVSGVTSAIQTQLSTKSTVTIQTSTNATTAMTSIVGQVVVVQVKADVSITTNSDVTVTLAYNAVTKDTQVVNGNSGDRFPLFLQYTETPGAATQNLTLTTSNGTLANIRYVITKIV